MGWTETHKPKGQKIADFFYEHGVTRWGPDLPFEYKVLDSALVNMSTWYAAIEKVEKATGVREVFAAVILVKMWKPKTGDYWKHNIIYKDMDETMGPCESQCPERILDLLTPTEHEYAKDWRARCRAYHERRKAIPKLSKGVCMKFGEPVSFGDYGKEDYFRITQVKGPRIVCDAYSLGIRVRLTRSLILGRMENGGVTFS